jgi:hypothetical protein
MAAFFIDQSFRTNPGSLAIFAANRRASSLVSASAADRRSGGLKTFSAEG